MITLPLHAVSVIVDDQVRLRVYRGACLELEIPLRRRQAMVLAAQLLNQALMPEYSAGPNRGVLEAQGQKRVADGVGKFSHG
jgi:hypothetical protein